MVYPPFELSELRLLSSRKRKRWSILTIQVSTRHMSSNRTRLPGWFSSSVCLRFCRLTFISLSGSAAYFLTIAVQRWLSIRMDFLGNSIILALGLIAVGYRSSASPSTLGVALTYALSITQSLSQMVQQLAQLEQDMNTVERVIFYADLPAEGDFVKPKDPEEKSWPSKGEVEFKNVSLRYRPELPLVLNDVSFKFKAGERVGVVGESS